MKDPTVHGSTPIQEKLFLLKRFTNYTQQKAKEILYKKATENNDGFLTGQVRWIVDAMEEYKEQAFIERNKCVIKDETRKCDSLKIQEIL